MNFFTFIIKIGAFYQIWIIMSFSFGIFSLHILWSPSEMPMRNIPLHTILFVNFNIPISLSLWTMSCSISFYLSSSILSLPSAVSNLCYPTNHPAPQSTEFLISIPLFFLLWKFYFLLSKMWLDICIVSYSFIIFWWCPLFFNIFNVLILVLIILLSTIFVGLIYSPLFFYNSPSCGLLHDLFCNCIYCDLCVIIILWELDLKRFH